MNGANKTPEISPFYFARSNYLGDSYAEIALKACCEALKILDNIDDTKMSISSYMVLHRELENRSIISIVFSQMALESFFNDYCAKCLGDDEYYHQFDSLPFVSKFLFISIAIFKKPCDKANTPCYSQICELSKLRNELIHNKSKEMNFDDGLYHIEEHEPRDYDKMYEEEIKWAKNYCLEPLNQIKNSIRTLYNTAKYFDSNDINARAMSNILGLEQDLSHSIFDESYKDYLVKKLNLT